MLKKLFAGLMIAAAVPAFAQESLDSYYENVTGVTLEEAAAARYTGCMKTQRLEPEPYHFALWLKRNFTGLRGDGLSMAPVIASPDAADLAVEIGKNGGSLEKVAGGFFGSVSHVSEVRALFNTLVGHNSWQPSANNPNPKTVLNFIESSPRTGCSNESMTSSPMLTYQIGGKMVKKQGFNHCYYCDVPGTGANYWKTSDSREMKGAGVIRDSFPVISDLPKFMKEKYESCSRTSGGVMFNRGSAVAYLRWLRYMTGTNDPTFHNLLADQFADPQLDKKNVADVHAQIWADVSARLEKAKAGGAAEKDAVLNLTYFLGKLSDSAYGSNRWRTNADMLDGSWQKDSDQSVPSGGCRSYMPPSGRMADIHLDAEKRRI